MGRTCPDTDRSGERIAKRLRGGSSIEMLRLGPGELPPTHADWIVEEYVEGADATVTVVEGAGDALALPAVVLDHVHGHGPYDNDAKLLRPRADRARGVRPAGMAAALAECERIAATMHTAVGARHISRCDFRVRDGEAYFLEINTLPGLSGVSNCTECAHAGGLSYDDLIALVVGAALPSPA
jgi:D-alanine-D-alanine ligase